MPIPTSSILGNAVGLSQGAGRPRPQIELCVNGQRYGGWMTGRVTRGIEAISGGFSLTVSNRWAGQETPWPIKNGDECSLKLGGETVITGRVDRREVSYSSTSRSLTVAGRDRTADLVDCSAVLDGWEFKSASLKTFAEKLCEPFGIEVMIDRGLATGELESMTRRKFHIDPGETAFNALESACRTAGVLPVSDGKGGLVLTRASLATRVPRTLIEGQNILEASASFNTEGRFHRYVVLGQHPAADDYFGPAAAHVKGEAFDKDVRDARVLVVRPETSVTPGLAKLRAQWEASVRAARAAQVSIKVQGWAHSGTELWPVNAVVGVCSPSINLGTMNGGDPLRMVDMLITEATYEISEGGTTTTLKLTRPDAYLPEPVKSAKGVAFWPEIARGV